MLSYNFTISNRAKGKTTRNTLVKNAQTRLSVLGYDPGPADGLFGKRVSTAITKFQQDEGLPVTGQLDAATVNKL